MKISIKLDYIHFSLGLFSGILLKTFYDNIKESINKKNYNNEFKNNSKLTNITVNDKCEVNDKITYLNYDIENKSLVINSDGDNEYLTEYNEIHNNFKLNNDNILDNKQDYDTIYKLLKKNNIILNQLQDINNMITEKNNILSEKILHISNNYLDLLNSGTSFISVEKYYQNDEYNFTSNINLKNNKDYYGENNNANNDNNINNDKITYTNDDNNDNTIDNTNYINNNDSDKNTNNDNDKNTNNDRNDISDMNILEN